MSTPTAPDAALASLAGTRTVRLITRGRKSGLPRPVTVWFVVDGSEICLGTLNEDRNWVRNARHTPEVELEIGSARLRGRFCEIAEPGEHAAVRAAIARKYWPARIAGWFGIGQKRTFRIRDVRPA